MSDFFYEIFRDECLSLFKEGREKDGQPVKTATVAGFPSPFADNAWGSSSSQQSATSDKPTSKSKSVAPSSKQPRSDYKLVDSGNSSGFLGTSWDPFKRVRKGVQSFDDKLNAYINEGITRGVRFLSASGTDIQRGIDDNYPWFTDKERKVYDEASKKQWDHVWAPLDKHRDAPTSGAVRRRAMGHDADKMTRQRWSESTLRALGYSALFLPAAGLGTAAKAGKLTKFLLMEALYVGPDLVAGAGGQEEWIDTYYNTALDVPNSENLNRDYVETVARAVERIGSIQAGSFWSGEGKDLGVEDTREYSKAVTNTMLAHHAGPGKGGQGIIASAARDMSNIPIFEQVAQGEITPGQAAAHFEAQRASRYISDYVGPTTAQSTLRASIKDYFQHNKTTVTAPVAALAAKYFDVNAGEAKKIAAQVNQIASNPNHPQHGNPKDALVTAVQNVTGKAPTQEQLDNAVLEGSIDSSYVSMLSPIVNEYKENPEQFAEMGNGSPAAGLQNALTQEINKIADPDNPDEFRSVALGLMQNWRQGEGFRRVRSMLDEGLRSGNFTEEQYKTANESLGDLTGLSMSSGLGIYTLGKAVSYDPKLQKETMEALAGGNVDDLFNDEFIHRAKTSGDVSGVTDVLESTAGVNPEYGEDIHKNIVDLMDKGFTQQDLAMLFSDEDMSQEFVEVQDPDQYQQFVGEMSQRLGRNAISEYFSDSYLEKLQQELGDDVDAKDAILDELNAAYATTDRPEESFAMFVSTTRTNPHLLYRAAEAAEARAAGDEVGANQEAEGIARAEAAINSENPEDKVQLVEDVAASNRQEIFRMLQEGDLDEDSQQKAMSAIINAAQKGEAGLLDNDGNLITADQFFSEPENVWEGVQNFWNNLDLPHKIALGLGVGALLMGTVNTLTGGNTVTSLILGAAGIAGGAFGLGFLDKFSPVKSLPPGITPSAVDAMAATLAENEEQATAISERLTERLTAINAELPAMFKLKAGMAMTKDGLWSAMLAEPGIASNAIHYLANTEDEEFDPAYVAKSLVDNVDEIRKAARRETVEQEESTAAQPEAPEQSVEQQQQEPRAPQQRESAPQVVEVDQPENAVQDKQGVIDTITSDLSEKILYRTGSQESANQIVTAVAEVLDSSRLDARKLQQLYEASRSNPELAKEIEKMVEDIGLRAVTWGVEPSNWAPQVDNLYDNYIQ